MSEPFNVASYFVDRNIAEGRGERIALVHDRGETSYRELAALVNRVGNVLFDLGVRRGDRVLLVLSDSLEFVASWYAAQKIGAVTAEAYTFLQPKDLRHFITYTDARVVLADAASLPAVREALVSADQCSNPDQHSRPPEVLAVGVDPGRLGEGEHALEVLAAKAPEELEAAPTTADDVAIWKFTTGSTGAPKACVHPAGATLASHRAYAEGVLGIRPDDRVLAVPKLFFGYARDLVALYPFAVGGTGIVFGERPTPELLLDLVAKHRPTILVNVPTMMSAMVASPAAADADLSTLRLCTSAGEALPAQLYRKWDATFGVPVADGIGSSEAYHIFISNRPGAAHPGSVGTLVPGYDARIVDDAGAEVPIGEVGVLEVTGPTIAREYHGDPEKSAATFRGATLHTGDLFSVDDQGRFSHHGRADDLLKVHGIWVAPSEIEHCLIGHPDVLECGVVGHDEDGLVLPRAYVVLRDGATTSADDLLDYARENLSGHKRPRDLRFVAELPRTSNGKLDRRALQAIDQAEEAS